MKKKKHPMRVAGWECVKLPSHMIDSIWTKDDMLHIIFATGQQATFGQLAKLNELKEE